MPITLDGTLGITTPALTVTGATVNTGGISTAGNLTFTSTGNRITGDFSSATYTNRVSFQSSTTNGVTGIQALPNGTNQTATFDAYNAADPTNAAFAQLQINSTDVRVVSNIRGTGTYLPMVFYTGGSERMRIGTTGLVGIGTASPQQKLAVSNGGAEGIEVIPAVNASESRIQSYNRSGAAWNKFSINSSTFELFVNGGTSAIYANTSGQVGINNTSPSGTSKLDVNGQIYSANGTAGAPGFTSRGENNAGLFFGDDGAASWVGIAGGGVEQMRVVGSTGYVGIGTSSPSYKLHVNGNMYSTTSAKAGTNIDVTGTNLNSYNLPGSYVGYNLTNAPTAAAAAWCFVEVFSNGSDQVFQRCTPAQYQSNSVWNRMSSNGGSTWGSWFKEGGTGGVIQVQQAIFTGTQTISATSGFNWTDITNLSITITPTTSTSKFLLQAYLTYTFAADRIAAFRFQGGNSTAFVGAAAGSRAQAASWSVSPGAGGQLGATSPMVYLDSPGTTSPITYKVQGGPNYTSGNLAINYNITNDGDLNYIARGACSFIIMEISG